MRQSRRRILADKILVEDKHVKTTTNAQRVTTKLDSHRRRLFHSPQRRLPCSATNEAPMIDVALATPPPRSPPRSEAYRRCGQGACWYVHRWRYTPRYTRECRVRRHRQCPEASCPVDSR